MAGRFVGEPIEPVVGTFDTAGMASGEPGLPGRFRWRGTEYEVAAVLQTRKTTSPCRNGGAERYVRKHWFRVRTTSGEVMEISFDRRGGTRGKRWRLFSMLGSAETQAVREGGASLDTGGDNDMNRQVAKEQSDAKSLLVCDPAASGHGPKRKN